LLVQTSGTTGQPLGVVINHRTLLDTIQNYSAFARITADDRFTLLTAPAFLAAYTAIFGALLNGATLLPFEVKSRGAAKLAAWLREEAVTVYQSTPSLFRVLARNLSPVDRFPQLRFLRLGGEPVLASDFELFRNHFEKSAILANTLGISEAGGNVAYFLMPHDFQPRSHLLPVGLPSRGREIILMDEAGRPVPPGQLGEIVVRSEFLASGYDGNEELTARRFRSSSHGRELWTGDLGRLTPEGWLEHTGRKDDQVKVRGQRVDLSELESILRSLDGVEAAVALLRQEDGAAPDLAAFVVLRPDRRRTASELREELAGRISSHLMPHLIKIVGRLPLGAGGKIDRKALLQSAEDALSDHGVTGPRSPLEKEVAEIWREILGLAAVGVYDNFFASGGDSLKALSLLSQLSAKFGVEPTARDLLERSTVAQMAEYISFHRSRRKLARWKILFGSARSESTVPLRTAGSRLPLFIFPGGRSDEGALLLFASMMPHFPADLPVYGLKHNFSQWTCLPARSLKVMARNFRNDILRLQPQGPYHLLSDCVGAIVLLEVASQLEAAGRPLAPIILLDPKRPAASGEWANSSKLRRYYRVLREAPPASFAGPVKIIAPRNEDEVLRRFGPNPFAPGQVEWIKVPGDHDSYMREHRMALAREIARLLDCRR
jgi:phenylacetate-coenzyme A ligase PaaK-like adenylate-forming protein/acyl carrier protein